jgi:heme-degrading monooxygenase HmoA
VAEEVVLINAFEVPAGGAEDFITAWERTRDYLQDQPGYVDTALHQAVRPGAEFEFVNVARWRSAGDFAAATQSPGFRDAAAGLAGYRPHPALYRVLVEDHQRARLLDPLPDFQLVELLGQPVDHGHDVLRAERWSPPGENDHPVSGMILAMMSSAGMAPSRPAAA